MKGNKTNSNKNRTMIIVAGFSCNNNCLMCSFRPDGRNTSKDRTFAEIIKMITRARQAGYENIEFSGGEPTIRKDIIELVSEARKLGFKTIALSTNGRLFGYEPFCDKIIAAGLNKVTFSLLGSSGKVHDAVTRTPGSFDQIVEGIRNVQNRNIFSNVSTVISRLNFRDTGGIAEKIKELGIKNWYLLDLIPDGNSKTYYDQLVVRAKDLYNEFIAFEKRLNGIDSIGFFDFPFCIFGEDLRDLPNAMFINAKQRKDTSNQIGFVSKRISYDDNGKYADSFRRNIEICDQCRYFKECGGIWSRYLDKYGEVEIRDLAKKNNCIQI